MNGVFVINYLVNKRSRHDQKQTTGPFLNTLAWRIFNHLVEVFLIQEITNQHHARMLNIHPAFPECPMGRKKRRSEHQ
jgi:hypothetical protein